ncbi:MAG: hypothetical protein Q8Q09_16570 [Deltaproteobacteria bacterium]|nr:hypothetical protein [Deltaproteobacteria bacterium]
MAALPIEVQTPTDDAPLLRNESGTAYTEMLVCFMPMFLMITCLIQMALMNVAHLMVQHAAVLAARAAIVVLPDNPACYDGTEQNQLATGATGDENIIQSFLGSLGSRTPIPSDFGGLGNLIPAGSRTGDASDPQNVFSQTNNRYMAIHSAASMPLMALAPTPLMLRSRTANIGQALAAGGPGALLARMGTALVYNRAGLAVTFLNNGTYTNSFGERDMVTARVTYAFNCGVPLARSVMCKDALGIRYPTADAVRRAVGGVLSGPLTPGAVIGAVGAIRDAERSAAESDPGAAELRTAPNSAGLLIGMVTGQRFAVVRGEASMPNQGAGYGYRNECGHRAADTNNNDECQ